MNKSKIEKSVDHANLIQSHTPLSFNSEGVPDSSSLMNIEERLWLWVQELETKAEGLPSDELRVWAFLTALDEIVESGVQQASLFILLRDGFEMSIRWLVSSL